MTPGNIINGVHLIADGSVPDAVVFSQHNLDRLLKKIVSELGMTIIDGPRFKQVPVEAGKLQADRFIDEGGISGYCMISTSHVSIHCWPLRHLFMMDVFSCCSFNSAIVLELLHKELQPNRLVYHELRRAPPAEIWTASQGSISV